MSWHLFQCPRQFAYRMEINNYLHIFTATCQFIIGETHMQSTPLRISLTILAYISTIIVEHHKSIIYRSLLLFLCGRSPSLPVTAQSPQDAIGRNCKSIAQVIRFVNNHFPHTVEQTPRERVSEKEIERERFSQHTRRTGAVISSSSAVLLSF